MITDLTSGQPFRRWRSKFTGFKHYFSNLMFFYHDFRTIGQRTTNFIQSCFSRQNKLSDIQSCLKSQFHILTSRPILGLRSDQVKIGNVGYSIHFVASRQRFWYQLHSCITFGSKVIGRRVIMPIGL